MQTPDQQTLESLIQAELFTVETFEAYLAQPENRRRTLSLVNGELVEKIVTQDRGVLTVKIITALGEYLEMNPIGRAMIGVIYRSPNDNFNARRPTASFIRTSEAKPEIKRGITPYMPDLVVEIQLPDDSVPHMLRLAADYLERGVGAIWLVLVQRQHVAVVTAEGVTVLTAPTDVIEGGDLLPDFTLPLGKIFR